MGPLWTPASGSSGSSSMADDVHPEDVFGTPLRWLLPRPIPYRYALLEPEERDWRGRAALRLWLLGYSVRTAWLHALSEDPEWSHHLRYERVESVDDRLLPGEVLRRRLMDVVRAEATSAARSSGPCRP
jgi:hypothetical protein